LDEQLLADLERLLWMDESHSLHHWQSTADKTVARSKNVVFTISKKSRSEFSTIAFCEEEMTTPLKWQF
jgi:hypothetical protein